MMSELKTAIQSIRARRIAGLRGYLRRPVQTQVRRNVKVKQLGIHIRIDNTDRIYPDRNDNAQIPVTAEIIFPALQVFLELCIRDIRALLTVSDKDRPTLLPRSLILLSILLCRQYLYRERCVPHNRLAKAPKGCKPPGCPLIFSFLLSFSAHTKYAPV